MNSKQLDELKESVTYDIEIDRDYKTLSDMVDACYYEYDMLRDCHYTMIDDDIIDDCFPKASDLWTAMGIGTSTIDTDFNKALPTYFRIDDMGAFKGLSEDGYRDMLLANKEEIVETFLELADNHPSIINFITDDDMKYMIRDEIVESAELDR